MSLSRRSLLTAVAAAASTLPIAAPVGAQGYPEREIKIICGFAPGSGADIVVRYFAEKVRWGVWGPAGAPQPIVVKLVG